MIYAIVLPAEWQSASISEQQRPLLRQGHLFSAGMVIYSAKHSTVWKMAPCSRTASDRCVSFVCTNSTFHLACQLHWTVIGGFYWLGSEIFPWKHISHLEQFQTTVTSLGEEWHYSQGWAHKNKTQSSTDTLAVPQTIYSIFTIAVCVLYGPELSEYSDQVSEATRLYLHYKFTVDHLSYSQGTTGIFGGHTKMSHQCQITNSNGLPFEPAVNEDKQWLQRHRKMEVMHEFSDPISHHNMATNKAGYGEWLLGSTNQGWEDMLILLGVPFLLNFISLYRPDFTWGLKWSASGSFSCGFLASPRSGVRTVLPWRGSAGWK